MMGVPTDHFRGMYFTMDRGELIQHARSEGFAAACALVRQARNEWQPGGSQYRLLDALLRRLQREKRKAGR